MRPPALYCHRAGGAGVFGRLPPLAAGVPRRGLQGAPAGAGDALLAAADACIAAQNAVTAAGSLGLGSCYIGDVLEQCEAMRAALRLPAHVLPAAMLVMGRPTRQQQERPKPARFAPEYIVCENVYREKDRRGAPRRPCTAGGTGGEEGLPV